MTTEVWDPSASNSDQPYAIEQSFLRKIILKIDPDNLDSLNNFLTEKERETHRPIMIKDKEAWFSAADNFSDEELIALIQFFTLAETHYANWSAEEKSPVIWLTKLLKKRKKPLDKELLKWIKNNNNNKFLPFGAL